MKHFTIFIVAKWCRHFLWPFNDYIFATYYGRAPNTEHNYQKFNSKRTMLQRVPLVVLPLKVKRPLGYVEQEKNQTTEQHYGMSALT